MVSPPFPFPFPSPPPFNSPKFSDKPVGGKVRSSEGEVPRLPPPATNTTLVITVIRWLPDKSSADDPIPTSVLKQVSPFVAELVQPFTICRPCPSPFQGGIRHTSHYKKAGLDATDVSSCRPISNLSVLSKLLERLVVQQLMDYLKSFNLLPQLQ